MVTNNHYTISEDSDDYYKDKARWMFVLQMFYLFERYKQSSIII